MFPGLTEAVLTFFTRIVNMLPQSPFRPYIGLFCTEGIQNSLSYVNWLLPLDTVVMIFSVWLAAISVVYIFNVIMTSLKIVL